jgi:Holliday junction resolvasome RuvABC DNA-binding subunit
LIGDHRLLATVPGLGKTGAERIILELKKKTALLAAEIGSSVSDEGARSDAVLGLMALGYSQNEASAAIGKIESESHDTTAAGIIREALRFLKEKNEE